jgi:hypothetical protein
MTLSTLLELLAGAFTIGGLCTLTLYKVKNLERLVKKAHQRLDLLDDRRWVKTDVLESSASEGL